MLFSTWAKAMDMDRRLPHVPGFLGEVYVPSGGQGKPREHETAAWQVDHLALHIGHSPEGLEGALFKLPTSPDLKFGIDALKRRSKAVSTPCSAPAVQPSVGVLHLLKTE